MKKKFYSFIALMLTLMAFANSASAGYRIYWYENWMFSTSKDLSSTNGVVYTATGLNVAANTLLTLTDDEYNYGGVGLCRVGQEYAVQTGLENSPTAGYNITVCQELKNATLTFNVETNTIQFTQDEETALSFPTSLRMFQLPYTAGAYTPLTLNAADTANPTNGRYSGEFVLEPVEGNFELALTAATNPTNYYYFAQVGPGSEVTVNKSDLTDNVYMSTVAANQTGTWKFPFVTEETTVKVDVDLVAGQVEFNFGLEAPTLQNIPQAASLTASYDVTRGAGKVVVTLPTYYDVWGETPEGLGIVEANKGLLPADFSEVVLYRQEGEGDGVAVKTWKPNSGDGVLTPGAPLNTYFDVYEFDQTEEYSYYVTVSMVGGAEASKSANVALEFTTEVEVPATAYVRVNVSALSWIVSDNAVKVSFSVPTTALYGEVGEETEYDITGKKLYMLQVWRQQTDKDGVYLSGDDNYRVKVKEYVDEAEAGKSYEYEDKGVVAGNYYVYEIGTKWTSEAYGSTWGDNNATYIYCDPQATQVIDHKVATDVRVAADKENEGQVIVTWTAPAVDATTIRGYNVYVDNERVTSLLLTDCTYTYTLPADVTTISVAVETVYVDNQGVKSDTCVYSTSGVESLSEEAAPVRYFNLQGVEVANPLNGLYIRVRQGKAERVIIR